MKNQKLTRRDFFVRATAVGALSVGSGTLLAACGGGDSQSDVPPPPPPVAQDAAVDCSDLSAVSEGDLATRGALQYVETTENADQRCDNCVLYIAAADDASCNGCQVIKGPIEANGYCVSWAAKPTT